MSLLQRLFKPEYVFQPRQLLRRLARRGPLPETADVRTPWGLPMRVRPGETVGHALYHLGVLDLAACEVAWRLLDPGETAVDVGANIGVFTGLFARRTGPRGEVWAFEPHPAIHPVLRTHVERWQGLGLPLAPIRLHAEAVSDVSGEATLFEPEEFASNAGTATLAARTGTASHTVPTRRLDELLPTDRPFHVMKVDTEGHETAVFRGAARLLGRGRVRDIVFEEHEPPPTESTRLLADAGYTLFFIGRSFGGPRLTTPADRGSLPAWLPPNYLATRDPERAVERCRAAGWRVLRG